jgi:DNA/RNA endonuclease YhcR with UshA esterase domain
MNPTFCSLSVPEEALMRRPVALLALALAVVALAAEDKEAKPLSPAEAIKRVGQKVTVEMRVRASKNALEHRGEIYLDSEENFRDEENLAVVINKDGAARFKEAGVDDPAAHFKGKTVRVTGTVTLQEKRPRVVVNDPKQLRLVGTKE